MLSHTSNTFVSYNWPLKEADAVFCGIPFSSKTISKGAIYGPLMVRESLKLKHDYVAGKNIFERVKVCDVGDVDVLAGSFDKTAQRIKETIEEIKIANSGAFPIFIGGDHSITLPLVEALRPKTIVHLDAHADVEEDDESSYARHSHASWARHAAKLAKVVQVGVTVDTGASREVANAQGISVFRSAEEFLKSNIKIERPVHLTIDIDVLAPGFIGETGFPEGRMMPEELYKVLQQVDCDSLDIVEIADDKLPSKGGFVAAEIIMRVLGKRFLV